MQNHKDRLWQFSKKSAILSLPLIWIILIIIFSLSKHFADWPDSQSQNLIMIISTIIGFIPLLLVLLDFFSSRGAVIETKWGKLDFSKIDLSREDIRKESIGLPENIGIPGAIVYDSSGMQIISTLQMATANEIVIIDIKDGNAWWVSRLLALSAGAVRAGSPKVFVFKGTKENKSGMFLGWTEAGTILNAILNARSEYKETYDKAWRITRQVNVFGTSEFIPASITLNSEVQRYIYSPYGYVNLGDAAFEQILMEQLAKWLPNKPEESLEQPPDWLSMSRFNDLFGPYLYRESNYIDLEWPGEKQISQLLNSPTPYLALVRNGRYESMLSRADGERMILKELFRQSQENKD